MIQPKNKIDNSAKNIKTKNFVPRKRRDTLFCFSHLRWDFVYQRPQHLMSRFAAIYDVLYIEEPIYIEKSHAFLEVREVKSNIFVLQPQIPSSFTKEQEEQSLFLLLYEFILANRYDITIRWYFTPMMMKWSKQLSSQVTIYDCMDELSAFKYAPSKLKWYEQELMAHADLVFTGGSSLYEAKRFHHESVHLFPSSVDSAHFYKARNNLPTPRDQALIPQPRIGFYGVIDERFDKNLLANLAKAKPDWHFVILGPVVKINFEELPKALNIHYLGAKTYEELPYYLSGWDVALIPFAINESTRFISPTKTPEYLAGGKPVVSTPIKDIVSTYKRSKIVHIAKPDDTPAFIKAIESALENSKHTYNLFKEADSILQNMSWDKTFSEMHELMLMIRHNKKVV